MSRRLHSADSLLREYAETRSILSGAKAQNLIAHSGGTCALLCATKDCAGSPKRVTFDGIPRWTCSRCRKLWPIEEKDLGRREFQDSTRGVTIGDARIRLGDFAVILRRIQQLYPWPYVAWWIHVLAPTYEADENGGEVGLGVALDLVPERMQKLSKAGEIDPLPGGVTLYRVRQWIQIARAEAMRQIWIAGL